MKHLLLCISLTLSTLTPTQGTELTLTFSHERGYYTQPFSVSISCSDVSAQLFYTTNGDIPTPASTSYSQAIAISGTTPLSILAIKDSLRTMVTQTYLFINQIVTQPNTIAGYPDRWGALNYAVAGYAAGENAPADYAMDAAIINNSAYQSLINQAFEAIPFVSIVTNRDYIFSHSTNENTGGIYIYTGDTGNPQSNGGNALGAEWERPASIEFYEPLTAKQFQQNCGLRLHGGNSRKPYNTGKHSFRVSFRNKYGKGKLRFPLFDDADATARFDHLVLRAGYNYSWTKNTDEQLLNTQYIYDSFAKQTQLDMGHIGCHDQFVHLFINGLYWGLYDLSEKINDNHLDAYLGGADMDYDVINDDGIVDGNTLLFDQMKNLAKDGNFNQLTTDSLLFFENFIDYMLLNFYVGNNDWGSNNWFAGISRVNRGNGFRFYVWDAETAFTDVNINKIKGNNAVGGALREILFGSTSTSSTNGGLFQNATFKTLFAQRVGLHLLGDGALTPAKTAERYQSLADEIDLPIILESARWGDFRSVTMPHGSSRITYTRNNHWLPRKQSLLQNYFPQRTAKLIQQLAEIGITPIPSDVFTSENDKKIVIYFADNRLFFALPDSENISIEVFTLDGKMVSKINLQNAIAGLNSIELNLQHSAVYLYRLTGKNTIYNGKILKL
jgi:hypothetical protein